MKYIPYKGYFIRPASKSFWSMEEVSVTAFPGSSGIFFFKSVRAAKCFITRHLTPKS